MTLDPDDLEIIEDLITQKVDSEIFVLRQDLSTRLTDLEDAVQSIMEGLAALK